MGTNNTPYCTPEKMVDCTPEKMVDHILGLRNCILQKLPICQIVISTPTLRTDNIAANTRNKLILDDNIEKKHLHCRGLHLRMSVVMKLSENLVKSIQS